MRAKWSACEIESKDALFSQIPSAVPPYTAGRLGKEAKEDALSYLMFLRYLVGFPQKISVSEELTDIAQTGAVLMAAGGELSHTPKRPEDMEDAFYEVGRMAAAESNLAMFNWASGDILRRALDEFVRDDSGENLMKLGHRRWLLSPFMGYTGFGLANDPDGRSYVAMYVYDQSAPQAYDYISWPSAGAFPAELMTRDTPWSVSFNPERYDLNASAPVIELTDLNTGDTQRFDTLSEPDGEKYFWIDDGRYGGGPVYVFRPQTGGDYTQNQRFEVRISGMAGADGRLEDIVYVVSFASLTPIEPAAIELSGPKTLHPGDSAALSARVIPDWADDLDVTYESSAPEIVQVDAGGKIKAVGEGSAMITARTVNGKTDSMELTVSG